MARRVVLLLALCLLLGGAAPALAGLGDQKATVDAKLAAVQASLARSRARESQLSAQVGSLTSRIHALEQRVGNVSARLSVLQEDVALHQRRLDTLDALYHVQTVRYLDLRRTYRLAVQRLDNRLVDIYKQNQPTAVDVILAAHTIQDVLDQLNYLGLIAKQDKSVAHAVAAAKHDVALARAHTEQVRRGVQQEQRVIAARAQQQAILRGELLSSRGRLASARAGKSHALIVTKQQEASEIRESQALQAASAQLAAKLRAAAARSSTGDGSAPAASGAPAAPATPSAAGFIWPVSGPITSPFGMRWGTLHPGIDIGVPEGTPVHAAAAGTVVWCGWMSGYGNLVMIDHHNGLATAYGHNSRIAVSCGEQVAQGQVISYSGCTGFCTGPHVHFEVRVNGTPVDPLGYLP